MKNKFIKKTKKLDWTSAEKRIIAEDSNGGNHTRRTDKMKTKEDSIGLDD